MHLFPEAEINTFGSTFIKIAPFSVEPKDFLGISVYTCTVYLS